MSSTTDLYMSTVARALCQDWIRYVVGVGVGFSFLRSFSLSPSDAHTLTSGCPYHGSPFATLHALAAVQVTEAVSLLKKPKKARKAHPLFARGFDEMLTMRVRTCLVKM